MQKKYQIATRAILITATLLAMVAPNLRAQISAPAAGAGVKSLRGHVDKVWQKMTPLGRAVATNEMLLAIGLTLRDQAGLEKLLAEIADPTSPNFRKFLTPDEIAARFGPTEADYDTVKNFALSNGFTIAATHDNRLVLDVRAPVANVERAFNFNLLRYPHPTEAREFFAPDAEPSVPAALPLADVQGLNNFSRPHPHSRRLGAMKTAFHSGTSPDGQGLFFGDDFRKAYAPGTTLTGAGQMVGLLQFDGYYPADVTSYAKAAGGGRTNIVIQKVLIDGFSGTPTTGANSGNGEVSLDIEMSMAMAPGLAKIVVFEGGPNGLQNDILNTMLASNMVKNLSCSWGWGGGPTNTTDNIFKFMAVAGQSFFNASGDTDAFVAGSNNDVDSTGQFNAPSSCPYITQVGGTVMATNGFNAAYTSESVWNDRTVNPNGGNWGSSGGISTFYAIPSWQTNTSMAANGGSTTKRNIPDVALAADYVYSTYDNGSSGRTGGTSCAAPLWAGFMALVNQQIASQGGTSAGFINPAVYALSQTANYANCFHDITVGDNSWSSSSSKFSAVTGYDLATGLGTPKGTNLINALAPAVAAPPTIVTSPTSQTNAYGATATFNVTVSGTSPFYFQWYFTNAIAGATNASLVISNLTTANAGNYYAVVTNAFGSATSTLASLAVLISPPAIVTSPLSLTNNYGSTATFSITASGALPLVYQWYFTNAISGATNSSLVISNVAAASSGNYYVVVTNIFGIATSSPASLTVILSPIISQQPASQSVLIGQSANFSVTASGAPSLAYQWRKNGGGIAGANSPNYSIASVAAGDAGNYDVIITNFSGSITSSVAVLTAANPAAYGGLLAGWETTGLSAYGPSPFAATTNAPNVTVIGLTRGSGVGTASTAAGNAWGGSGFVFANETAAIAGNSFATFSVAASSGYTVSFTNIAAYNIRHSSSGSTTGIWQYQIGSGAFTDIGSAITWGSVTSSSGNLQSAIDLSGIAALQNVPSGTSVTFRLVLWGGTGTGTWYINNISGNDLVVNGTLAPVGVTITPPAILTPPANTNVFAGKSAAFTVAATGTAPLAYQWLENGLAITNGGSVSGSLTNVLNISPVATNQSGSYSVIITNLAGSVTSSIALLNVAPLPLIVISNSTSGLVLAASGGAIGNNYVVQSATNLIPPANWLPLQTNVIGTNALIFFTDTNPLAPAQFYRIVFP